jgi:diguanylate cyclase (GGDEF)-like protein
VGSATVVRGRARSVRFGTPHMCQRPPARFVERFALPPAADELLGDARPVRLIDYRHDAPLAAGLVAATVVVFQQPLRWLLDLAGEVEHRYSLDLIPALVVLSAVFVVHQYRKRQETNVLAAAAAAEARSERDRARELEQLVVLGRSLANALDFSAVRQAVWRHLPDFLRNRALWVVLRERNHWRTIVEDSDTPDRVASSAIENIAAIALTRTVNMQAGSVNVDGYECFPMSSSGTLAGMLVMREGGSPLTHHQRRALEAALAFLGIAIRNVQLLVDTHENSMRDSLTRWFNRGHGSETLRAELQRARRSGSPVSLLMFDIDRFKSINDQYGHQAGDAVLMSLARQVGDLLRASDVKCRYGGDAFMVNLPETPSAGAQQVAEYIRRAVANLHVAAGSDLLSVTASVGVTTSRAQELDPEAMIARADAALYQAKHGGRNRVAVDITSVELVEAVG